MATPEGAQASAESPYRDVVWALDLVVHALGLMLAPPADVRSLMRISTCVVCVCVCVCVC